MAGSLSSIGLGSNGALSYDIIDKLKDADKSAIISPIERKIELNTSKQEGLSELKKLITELQEQAVALSDSKTYQTKDSSVSGDSVSVDVAHEAKEQSIEINVTSLAKKEIYQSQAFASESSTFASEAKTMTFTINGKEIDIDVTTSTTISELAELINEESGGLMEASVLNVGGDDPYKLIYKSKDTGEINNITRSNTGGLGFVQIQNAADAEFEYDGVDITSASNKIEDLVEGVSFTLTEEGASTITIAQNNEKIVEEMNNFVEKYNAVMEKLTEVTKYDSATKEKGLFQGTSEIRGITSTLSNILATTISSDNKTIADFGFTTNRDGTIELDEDEFKASLKSDSSIVEEFFKSSDGESGLFDKLYDTLFDIGTSSTGVMKLLDGSLETGAKNLKEAQEAAQKKLDDRYAIMAKRFASFDVIIGRISNQFKSLDMIIQSEINSKS